MKYTEDTLRDLDRSAIEHTRDRYDGDTVTQVIPNRWAHRAVGVVLAGGRATRMEGQDKPFVCIAEKSLIEHCETRLAPQVSEIVISGNGDLDRFGDNRTVLSDSMEGFVGPLAGILTAMRWAQQNAPHAFWIISAAVDTPFFPDNLVERFIMAMGGPAPSIVLAQSGENVQPTFGLWPITLADDLEAFLQRGERKVRKWAQDHNCSHAVFPGFMLEDLEIDPFFNINSPEDIDVAQAIADGLSELDS